MHSRIEPHLITDWTAQPITVPGMSNERLIFQNRESGAKLVLGISKEHELQDFIVGRLVDQFLIFGTLDDTLAIL